MVRHCDSDCEVRRTPGGDAVYTCAICAHSETHHACRAERCTKHGRQVLAVRVRFLDGDGEVAEVPLCLFHRHTVKPLSVRKDE